MLKVLALVLTPSLIFLFIISLNSQSPDLPNEYIPFIQRLKCIRQIQPAKGIIYKREDIYTTWLFVLLLILTIITLFQMFYQQVEIERKPFRIRFNRMIYLRHHDRWLLISFIILILYFILPDNYHGYWSFISSRLLLFFFLILIVWIASREMIPEIKLPVLITILVLNSFLLSIYIRSGKENNRAALEVEKASMLIPPYSTVLPVNQSDKWIYGHLSNYLGIDKPMIILENYEAELNYFPVNWNQAEMPEMLFGKMNSPGSCISWETNFNNDPEIIDFIFVIRNTENFNGPCTSWIDEVLSRDYELIFCSKNAEFELFRLRSMFE